MHRVSSLLPSWDRRASKGPPSPRPAVRHASDGGTLGSRVFGWAEKITPVASKHLSVASTPPLPARYGREHYWPTALDRECEKAARILKSFCTDGYLAQDDSTPGSPVSASQPQSPTLANQSMKKIPPRIIQNAVGLAIFSCMRSGLWMSGSGGSGILIARKADGTWSPPSGFLLHTAELGFVIGVDIYDCVLVINSVAALEMFTRPKTTLGTDVSLTVGPLLSAGLADCDIRWKELENTVLTYLKAKGQHRAVSIDGSLVSERGNENERFYGATVAILDILAGNVRKDIPEIQPLYEVIKAAEGRTDFDAAVLEQLSAQPAPGDASIETPALTPVSARPNFGVPSNDDPDPFGVIALEMAGLEIREAGTHHRPASTQFEYNPAPSSPLFTKFNNRQSVDTYATRSNRGSYMSNKTQASRMTDAYTQTDVGETPGTSPSPVNSEDGRDRTSIDKSLVREPDEVDYTKVDMSALKRLSEESLEVHKEEDEEPTARISIQSLNEEMSAKRLSRHSVISRHSVKEVTIKRLSKQPVEEEEEEEEEPFKRLSKQSMKKEELVEAASPRVSSEAPKPAASVPADEEAEQSSDFPEDERDADADDEDEDEDNEEEPVIFEVAATAQPSRAAIMSSQVTQVIQAKGALVHIPRRIPPPLPVRSPARTSRASKSDFGGDVSSLRSPLRNSFQSSAGSSFQSGLREEEAQADVVAEEVKEVSPEPAEVRSETPAEAPAEAHDEEAELSAGPPPKSLKRDSSSEAHDEAHDEEAELSAGPPPKSLKRDSSSEAQSEAQSEAHDEEAELSAGPPPRSQKRTSSTPRTSSTEAREDGAGISEGPPPKSHKRNTSSVHTTVIVNRLSTDSVPQTPSTLHTNGQTSSGEDDHEPRTPKPEEEVDPKDGDDSEQKKDRLGMGSDHERTPVAVA